MNGYLIFILAVLAGAYLLDTVLNVLNLRRLSPQLPAEFQGLYDAGRYGQSQQYLREATRFGFVQDTFMLLATVAFILAGGFNSIDQIARAAAAGEIISGLLFAGLLLVLSDLVHLPFSVYATFVIEQRYGFNKTTAKTFIADHLKGWLLGAAIGGPVFALLLWFFRETGNLAWLYCWGAVTVFQIFMLYIAPAVIMPIFNKFTPLAEGELKRAIRDYAAGQHFALEGIYTMDGSRRSTKSNAFFTGLGRFRRIVLFDTLIAQHTAGELVAVLAHEIGHYKKRHVLKHLIISFCTSGIMFYLLSFFLGNQALSAAFGMEHVSTYATLCFFGFLYIPIEAVIGLVGNILSRKHEFEADRFAARTCGTAADLTGALKKLSMDNLSNLNPHPAMVFFKYSHPPVLERIRRLQQL